MTSNHDNATVTPIVTDEGTKSDVEKQSFVQKTKTFVKNHKKSTIAVGALVGLVGLSALAGRKADDSTDPYEPSEESMEEARVALEEMGIPVTETN